jgi:hypothetical protein
MTRQTDIGPTWSMTSDFIIRQAKEECRGASAVFAILAFGPSAMAQGGANQ